MSIKRKPEPIPEKFANYEEAGDFWDEHDSTDYQDILEAVEVEVDLSEQHYVIRLDKRTAKVLLDKAQEMGIAPNRLASEVVQKTLVEGK
ncbi:MAG: hypothetical protein IBX36_05345 [Dehalococcoidia bacterium]|nr:hypothetical protein [Dehalococcoidia bacterium]